MIYTFNLIGSVLMIAGLGIAIFTMGSGGPATLDQLGARLAVAVPFFGAAFFGLLCLAVAGVLSRLDRIIHNTADIADALDPPKK